jgi:F0F1-type ATP synthase assembly protein I
MPKDSNANWGKFVGLGLEMAIGVGLGFAVGTWLDKRYGWNGKGVLVGTGLGLAAGMYLLIKQALAMNRDEPQARGFEVKQTEAKRTKDSK